MIYYFIIEVMTNDEKQLFVRLFQYSQTSQMIWETDLKKDQTLITIKIINDIIRATNPLIDRSTDEERVERPNS